MIIAIGQMFIGGSGGSGTGQTSFDLLRFNLKYNSTDYTYLTSAPYADTASFGTGQNNIRITTAGTPDSNWVVAAMYYYAPEPEDDRILFCDSTGVCKIWDRDWNFISQINGVGQQTCIDPEAGLIYTFYGGGTGCVVKNFAGTTITTYACTSTSSMCYFDYVNRKFYIAKDTFSVEIWGFSGSSILLEQTFWYKGGDGIAIDTIFNKLVNFDATNYIREQNVDGMSGIYIWPCKSHNTEGLCIVPDGSILWTDPSGFHDSIVGGNRLWWCDPRTLHRKYDRSPHMTRFSRFSGGTVSGYGDTSKITQTVGGKIYSPVYDTDGFTDTENASAWAYEFSSGGDADISFIGSDTAPTTTPKTQYDSDIPTYAGWGSTVPSAEQPTPGTFRYKQAVLLVKSADAPAPTITIQDLLDTIQPNLLYIQYREDTIYLYNNVSPNQVPRVPNQANSGANPFDSTTDSQRPSYSSALQIMADKDQNTNLLMSGSMASINDDTQGHIIVLGKRAATNTVAVDFYIGQSASNANRFIFKHETSAQGSRICIEEWDNAGALLNKVSAPADTSTVVKKREYICNGTTKSIKVNNVTQTLTVNNGSNNGNWFAGLAVAPIRLYQGFGNGLTGSIAQYRLTLYKSSVLTTEQNDLLDAFITQENLLA